MVSYVDPESRLRNRIRQVRLGQGLSQTALAARAGLRRETVRRVERDDGYAPGMQVALAICLALHRRLSSLWWIEPDPEAGEPGTPTVSAETEEAERSG